MHLFKPNYLVALNIGRTGDKIGNTSPYSLATLSHAINQEFGSGNPGAYPGQKPYSLVFLTDKPLEEQKFFQYQRLCEEKEIIAAKKQFSTFETEELIQHIKDACVGHIRKEFALGDINNF